MSYYYRRGYGITLNSLLVIILANVFFFFISGLMALKGYRLTSILGLTPILIEERPWTVLTAMFIHVGFWHLFANMLTLYFFGSYLIQLVGERKFLVIYFIGGIIGNLLFAGLAFMGVGSLLIPVVGASGAVYAIGGTLAVLRPKTPVYIFPIPVPIPLIFVVIGGFFIIFAGVAWQAHLGGLLTGLVAGLILKRQRY